MAYDYGYPPVPPPQYGYGYGYGPPVRRSAPVTVHVVAIMQYLGGLLGLVGAVLVAVVGAAGRGVLDDANLSPDATDALAGASLVVAAAIGAVSLFAIFIARRLQRGRQWARALVLLLSVLNLVGVLSAMLVGDARSSGAPGLVVPVLYLVLLNTSAARSWFRTGTY